MSTGYSDVPFVAGSVFGIRSWMHLEGELLSLTGRGSWTNGENVATCQPIPSMLGTRRYLEPELHRPASLECHCGFYATGMQPVVHQAVGALAPELENAVVGVVEGYGIVSMGSKGFRSEKARIVALVNAWYPLGTFWSTRLLVIPEPPKDILSANYPDALWYPDVDSMLDHHPLTDFRKEAGQAA